MKIGSDQQAAFRIVMRIADMDVNETEIGDSPNFDHTFVHIRKTLFVSGIHPAVPVDPEFVGSRGNSCPTFYLYIAHGVLKTITLEGSVDVEFGQGTIIPLPKTF